MRTTKKDFVSNKFCVYLVIIVIITIYSPLFNYLLVPLIDNSKLASLFSSIGCTYIGVTVIAFSFMTSVAQINIERMPYGLFYYFSKDKNLLSYFVTIFVLSLTFTSLNLITYPNAIGYLILAALVISFFIVFLLVKSYLRIFQLINPTEQLKFLLRQVLSDMSEWRKKVDNYLLEIGKTDTDINEMRLKFFEDNPEWLSRSFEALHFCNIYIRRYFTIGEKDICGQALGLIIVINQEYVDIKGKTFFAPDYFINHGHERDSFIHETLEQMKRDMQFSLANKDEELAKVITQATSKLVEVYSNISYLSQNNNKYHANLAVTYCEIFVVGFLHNNMWSALSEGIDLLSRNVRILMPYNGAFKSSIKALEDIALISLESNQTFYTEKSVLQLANLTIGVILTNLNNSEIILKHLQESLFNIAINYVSPSFNIFINSLAPYFSVNDPTQFLGQLENIIQHSVNKKANYSIVQKNISHWMSNVYEFDVNLLGKSVELKSDFLFIVFNWLYCSLKFEIVVQSSLSTNFTISQKTLFVLNELVNVCETDFGFDFIYRFNLQKIIIDIGINYYERSIDLYLFLIKGLIKWSLYALLNNKPEAFQNFFVGVLKLAICNKNEKNKNIDFIDSQLKEQNIKVQDFIVKLEELKSFMKSQEDFIKSEEIKATIKLLEEIIEHFKI